MGVMAGDYEIIYRLLSNNDNIRVWLTRIWSKKLYKGQQYYSQSGLYTSSKGRSGLSILSNPQDATSWIFTKESSST